MEPTPPPRPRSLRKRLLRVARFFALCYVCVLVLLMIFERSLLYPRPDPAASDWSPVGLVYEDVWLDADDQTRLHGWFLPHAASRAAVVYFHGNAEDVASCSEEMSWWRDQLGVSILVMDYRGYGKSQGKPHEKEMVADGVLACQWLADHEHINVTDIVLWGRSIGGGVAAGVAESIQPRAMVMECTFDSLTNVAATHFSWAPVRWLMSNRYPSAKRLQNYQGEFVQWHGDVDVVVPLASGLRLHEAVPSAKKMLTIGKGYGHNDRSPDEFRANVHALIERLASPPSAE